ncbi:hypothetical protein AWV63_27615 [Micromonospora rifamycinica]|uniref:Uncharacterized protein n=1 Tax=Micromonospora rifamycinica TaxID=291594 RepID=A0A109IFI6_9ACTN|nr:hypothetical protein AWV63_27615 [Micromonospora rifamycinica]SCG79694.1 hypothetical protein GA0070623_4730 [Micromonospora rifamycinica]
MGHRATPGRARGYVVAVSVPPATVAAPAGMRVIGISARYPRAGRVIPGRDHGSRWSVTAHTRPDQR